MDSGLNRSILLFLMALDPFVTQDGSRLYFSSNRPVRTGEAKDDFDTWYVELTEDGWGEPINPGTPLNGERSEIFVSTTKMGTIYFTAFDEGVGHIYRSLEDDGKYHIPERITLSLHDSISVGNPVVAADESFLIFSSTMLPGEGGSDLYVSQRTEKGNWNEIRNLGSVVNSSHSDFAPGISPDGQYLFFTSERPGVVAAISEGRPPGDLYQVLISKIIP
jgi:Tol biopolymer transport system component